jgi:histone-lysine N-methyltransferase SETMAR
MNLTREHFRVMIFYDFKLSLTPKQCEDRLAPSKATIYNWYREFKKGRVFLRDEFGEGGPRTAVADENIAAVRAMLEEVRRTSYEFIRATLIIGMSQIQNILHQQLDVKNFCYRWIPHKVTPDEKEQRIE